jgi:F0F1-type ATP synthase assembly protein I
MHGEFFIPIVLFLVTGLTIVTWIYFRSKEKQLMIEKGLSYEQMMEFFKTKRDPYMMLKIGIVTLFFGIGLGVGLLIDRYTGVEEWIPFLIISCSGLGFIVAFLITRALENKKN